MNDLQKQINQLQKEYDILDGIIDLKDAVIAKLKAKNERLKIQLEYDSRYNDMQAELDYGEKLIEKYKTCLQEIKKVYQWILDQWELDTKEVQDRILDLITKAEEEWK